MNNLPADCRGFAHVYIDGIVIYSRTLDLGRARLQHVATIQARTSPTVDVHQP